MRLIISCVRHVVIPIGAPNQSTKVICSQIYPQVHFDNANPPPSLINCFIHFLRSWTSGPNCSLCFPFSNDPEPNPNPDSNCPSFVRSILDCSAQKSSLKTGKKPDQDRNRTNQDRKFPGPEKTKTTVQSSVLHISGNFKTDKDRLQPVLTASKGKLNYYLFYLR